MKNLLLYKVTREKIEPPLQEYTTTRSSETELNSLTEQYITTPNPALDFINIEIVNINTSNFYEYEVIDLTGKLQNRGGIFGNTQINVTNLSMGLYIVIIKKDGQKVANHKVVITQK